MQTRSLFQRLTKLTASTSSPVIILLVTALVDVGANGRQVTCRVIIDNTSEKKFASSLA